MIRHPLLAVLFATAGCSASPAPDLTPNNPRNPNGAGPASVEIGAAANLGGPGGYALLAKTGITNVTGSSITGGNVGLSPAAASFITGFALVADPTRVFSTSASLVPPAHIYGADYADPTPANLTTAVLGMQAAYSDAAGRSPPDHLDFASGNLAGLTLLPGLYTWGSTVILPGDVTLSGGASDVWILQIANDLDVSSGKQVILSGGAQPSHVFWQVAGKVTLHTGAHLEGVVLCKTAVTLQTMAALRGRALAQTLVALDNNSVTVPQ